MLGAINRENKNRLHLIVSVLTKGRGGGGVEGQKFSIFCYLDKSSIRTLQSDYFLGSITRHSKQHTHTLYVLITSLFFIHIINCPLTSATALFPNIRLEKVAVPLLSANSLCGALGTKPPYSKIG